LSWRWVASWDRELGARYAMRGVFRQLADYVALGADQASLEIAHPLQNALVLAALILGLEPVQLVLHAITFLIQRVKRVH
jgi:hypothetical protein